jgi:hypothetical protein
MINNPYPYLASGNNTWFFFESEGPQGKIPKVVAFRDYGNNIWNIGFGDLRRGKIQDSVVSNNQDLVRVMNTVAQTIRVFLETHPAAILQIRPVDERRKRLYNGIFQRRFAEIDKKFRVVGIREGITELYSPKQFYDKFEISLNFEQ